MRPQPVLRCERCNKPFDKGKLCSTRIPNICKRLQNLVHTAKAKLPGTSLKRHGYYCRSRDGLSAPRTRSCLCCAKRKARCDHKRPSCSRCAANSIECRYPPTAGGHNNDSPATTSTESSGDLATDNFLSQIDDVLAKADSSSYLGLDDSGIDWTRIPNPEYLEAQLQSRYQSVITNTSPSPMQPPPGTVFPLDLMPLHPTPHLRVLVYRPTLTSGNKRTVGLLRQTFKSYPLMISRHAALPPFIHPHLVGAGAERIDMEPLNNCISLMHLVHNGVQGSRKLFWRNVRVECENLCAKHALMNKWELLAAMHALCMYIILRLDEGETEDNNVDTLLIDAVFAMCEQLANGGVKAKYDSVTAKWEDWIFEESRRRLCTVYRILDMIIPFQPAALCSLHGSDLVVAPLPSKKQLWEAMDEFSWQVEREKEPEDQAAFALTSKGDLVELLGRDRGCALPLDKALDAHDRTGGEIASWGEWCSGMDGFGGLVMLAASLSA